VLAGTSNEELVDFVGAKFYCPHALADGKQHIWIREKTLEFQQCYLHSLHTLSVVLFNGHKMAVVVVVDSNDFDVNQHYSSVFFHLFFSYFCCFD